MYLKITNKCNMKCGHCGMSSNSKGKHMTREVWKAAINLAKDHGEESITIGGGEPTLHPDFWAILGLCMGSFEYVWMATNGSIPEIAIPLARLAKKGAIGCALSQDQWHDPITPEVIRAFSKDKQGFIRDNDNDSREIRRTVEPFKAGRCKDGRKGCVCSDVMLMPDGIIRGCACPDAPYFGTVFNPQIPEFWQRGECSKDQTDEDDHS